ncbi:MAG: VWA domain-containing protein [Thermomicrobiales bacterium]|nr:VWA domain-containing protein [Thermomicrobiales bacterium]
MSDLSLSFARPGALWLLLLLPVILIVGWRTGRRRSGVRRAAWLRALAVALLCVALAEPLIGSADSATSTIFVVDQSSSIDDSTSGRITSWVNEALAAGGSSDRAAVIAFGGAPELLSASLPAGQISPDLLGGGIVQANATNIESALAMARSLPLTGSRRIVLVSDGAENSGSAIAQGSQLAADETPVDVLPVVGIGADDFRIEGVTSPSSIWAGEQVSVLLSVVSSVETDGTVEIVVDGGEPVAHDVRFSEGLSSHLFTLDDLPAGFHAIDIRATAAEGIDAFPQNNATSRSVVVRDTPSLLLVSAGRSDSSFLREALESRGAVVTSATPENIPERLSDLTAFDVVLLNNVPAAELTVGQVAALETLTREFGRGLVVIGGSAAYGPGGYSATPLEEMLPVSVKVTEGKERQRVALMLIIDKSGSMGYDPLQPTSKIAMAREAARLAAGALSAGDEIGILVFNGNQQWIVRLTRIEGQDDRDRINAAIDTINADGSTEIFPALEVGFDEIVQSDADVRHVILLSDGKSGTGTRSSYEQLVAEFGQSNTTLSTIAIGEDADTDLLQFLAEQGNGNYHTTSRPEEIPTITLQEAVSAGSQSIISGAFQPIQVGPSPILTGFDPESLPIIERYDYSEIKESAQEILTSQRNDPILAKWQYGLGRVVAWTADDGIDFAEEWRSWSRYEEFWASVVRWTLPDPESGPVSVEVERDGTDIVLTVRAQSVVGDYVDLSGAMVDITAPDGTMTGDLPLHQSAPGEYQLRIADPAPGAYQFALDTGDLQAGQQSLIGFAIPESPELQPSAASAELLASIAARTGGRMLSIDDPAEVFDLPSNPAEGISSYRAIWWLPLSLALILFLTELAQRYELRSQLAHLRRA